jgi:hypothetical protein
MRTSGLPCRANPDCEVVFSLSHQDSMEALRQAASLRDAHELEAHDYRHVATTTLSGASTFAQGPAARRGRGRKRAEELNVI